MVISVSACCPNGCLLYEILSVIGERLLACEDTRLGIQLICAPMQGLDFDLAAKYFIPQIAYGTVDRFIALQIDKLDQFGITCPNLHLKREGFKQQPRGLNTNLA